MKKLSKIEDKVNRLVNKCRRLEAELDQGVLDFNKANTNQLMEAEVETLRRELAGKEDKLSQITAKMEKLQSLVKSL